MDFQNVQPLISTIPVVSSNWSSDDYWNAVKVRWGIGRDNSKVAPGLYRIGNPYSNSDVFVSANYKLSFNLLRKNLHLINAWILVIDTKGVNVWCAAGKGNFGTEVLVKSITENALENVVNHKRLIVPQLAATGVASYKVKERTGFRVIFGPVRATDIVRFINAGYKATPEMRRIYFPFAERVKLIPVDLMYGKYKLLIVLIILFLLSGLGRTGFIFSEMIQTGLFPVLNVLTGYLAGIVFTPLLLPVIPFRAFALKGAFIGILSILILNFIFIAPFYERIALGFIGVSIASFMAMNFTGSSTFTSLSGVKLEMKWAIPFQISIAIIGFLFYVILKMV